MPQTNTLPSAGQPSSLEVLLEALGREVIHTEECRKLNLRTLRLHACQCLQLRIATELCNTELVVLPSNDSIAYVLTAAYDYVDPLYAEMQKVDSAQESARHPLRPELFRVQTAQHLHRVRQQRESQTAGASEEFHALVRLGAQYPGIPNVLPIIAAVSRVEHEREVYAPVLCSTGSDGRPALGLVKESMLFVTRPEMVFFHVAQRP